MKKRGLLITIFAAVVAIGLYGCGSSNSNNTSNSIAEPNMDLTSQLDTAKQNQADEIEVQESAQSESDFSDTSMPGNATTEQEQAYKKALSYLDFTSFSYKGLIEQLGYDGFSTEDATYAADNCGADWNEQALKKGKSYLEFTSFSEEGLVEQLKYDGFTDEQASYAARSIFGGSGDGEATENGSGGNVSQQNALEKAESYLSFTAFSYTGLIEQLEHDGFSAEDATYGADNCGADWNEQAVKKAKSYLSFTSFSRQELIDQLIHEGFTSEQANYGADQNGF